ncbi:MAG: galactose ABC transporter substrate-binding protein [Suipraeoptans sp.]
MKRKVVSLLLVAVMAMSLVACGSSSDSSGSSDGDGASESSSADLPILGAGIYSASDNFNSYIGKSISNSAVGVFETNIEDGQNDQATQTDQVDTMLAKGAKVIALSVVDVTAAPAIIEKAKNAGDIPVIFFNKEITDEGVIESYEHAYQVTSTSGDYGATIQGEMIVEEWNNNPDMDKNGDGIIQIVNLMGDPGHTASQPRADYVKKAIEDAGIEYELLAEDSGMWVTATAKDKMDAWISKFGDEIECIITANDAMALGALTSIEAAGFNTDGRDSDLYIPIIGIDALPEALEKIDSGQMIGSVLQDAKTQGEVIVKMAENMMNGNVVDEGTGFELDEEKGIRVPYQAITSENTDVAKETYE